MSSNGEPAASTRTWTWLIIAFLSFDFTTLITLILHLLLPIALANSITRAFLIEEATIVKRVLKGKATVGGKK